VEVWKSSKMLKNNNVVMMWLEQETDSAHLNLLHLVNIKQ
jgi:hypothetical protein